MGVELELMLVDRESAGLRPRTVQLLRELEDTELVERVKLEITNR